MGLKDWLASGWLTEHETSPEEIAALFAVAERDLGDCRLEGLSNDWRLNIAYNAALQIAVAALAACGYRAARKSHHYRVIESLALTAGIDAATVRLLDTYRTKRNRAGYETAGLVSDSEAKGMVELAERLRDEVMRWLKAEHPKLAP
jgi:hypothetical protein